ncbi:BTAD domain-containing putative transcriptional regulator [Glycomyces mayteni]|uniref:BTAD domain-containing putative transcriptional regulator n=1 Tax=Glycomyces mayteni TaxID=543887 RepID=A0ABW2D938_9ACTN|nr:BTAD domain-containing putative transcriptional regulator [Glycomyces mayteni]
MPESADTTPHPPQVEVEFGVLGPLRVAAGGTELETTAPRLRTFLAALVLKAGREVGVDELADAIWGADLPRNPRRAVQLCAVRVRAHLERLDAGHLVATSTGGYRLDVPADRTDAGRMRALVAEADAAEGDSAAELAAVTAALDCWRSEPLADVPSESLHREVAPGLTEQRLTLIERRTGLLLHAGNAADLVDELVALTARYPLREGLQARLMEALHRSGRRGEALDAYHRYTRRLRDELGIDPGEAILALHKSILTSRAETGPDAPAVPRQLPSDTVAFTGRAAELERLDALKAAADGSPTPIVGVVTGTAGIGKTALAVHWARGVADEFPDGQLFVNLRGYHRERALPPHRVLARFMRALGVRGEDVPEDADELAAAYRSVMDGRRMLIVLDNAGSSDQVRPLLPGAAGSLVLVTSRDVLLGLIAAEGASQIGLELPTLAEARSLLSRRIGPDRLAAERRAADDIIAASARLPLALAIAAAQAVARHDTRLSTLAEQLGAGLDAFGAPSTETDVRAVFSWSYRSLSPDAARLLRLLGLHPGPDITAAAAASLGDRTPPLAERLIAELVRVNLVTEHAPGRYALHDLMREYCAELLRAEESDADRDRAVHGVLGHYLRTGYDAAAAVNPQRADLVSGEVPAVAHPEAIDGYDSAIAWFTAETEVLLAVVDWAAAAGLDRQVWQLVWVLAGFLERQGAWTQWVACQQEALAAAERLGDPNLLAYAHSGIGRAYARMSRAEEAERHYSEALELHRGLGDLNGQSRIETSLAMLHERLGRYARALEHALRAVEVERRLGDSTGTANARNMVAWCYTKSGQQELALDWGRQAMAGYRRMGELGGEAAALDTIGQAYHQSGRYAEAIDNYRRSIRLNRRLGDRYFEAMGLLNLGDSQAASGDRAAARDTWRLAGAVLDELQHPDADRARERLGRDLGEVDGHP